MDVVRQHLLRLLSRPSALQSLDVLEFLEMSVMRCNDRAEPSIKEGLVKFTYHNRCGEGSSPGGFGVGTGRTLT